MSTFVDGFVLLSTQQERGVVPLRLSRLAHCRTRQNRSILCGDCWTVDFVNTALTRAARVSGGEEVPVQSEGFGEGLLAQLSSLCFSSRSHSYPLLLAFSFPNALNSN